MTDLSPSPRAHLDGHSSWLSRLTSAKVLGHPLVWSAMTALFILSGYFWLQYYALPLSNKIKNEHPQSELIGANINSNWNPQIYKPIESMEHMPITRKADTLRAQDYRSIIELENIINPLLTLAREQLERQQYVSNDPHNAWLSYQKILDLDPTHQLAVSGQAQILSLLQGNAQDAVAENQYEMAERWLNQLDAIKPNHKFQTNLRQTIANQINAELVAAEAALRETERLHRLKSALSDAQNAINASPAELRMAFDLFSRALEIDAKNESALSGLRQIHLKRADLAKLAITKHDYQAAGAQITRLQETNAEPELLSNLEQAVAKAKASEIKRNQDLPIESAPASEKTAAVLPDTNQPEQVTTTVKIESNPAPQLNVSNDSPAKILPSNSDQLQQLNAGIDDYYEGNYNSAFEKLHPLAEDDIARAQFRLGIMYYQGRTVVKNIDLATQWIIRALPTVLRASQNGDAWAQADLGTAYELGIGLNKDVKHSATLYKKSAEQGYAGAQTNLGVLYGTGDGVIYDRQLAVYWLKQAAAQGDKIAQENLKILDAR